jgi:hypothetical protein
MTDEQLSALLRLKRFEQPPAQYFDRLLQDVHRRQRSDMLRMPLWKIAAERLQTFFSEHSMGHLSYAGALAAVLVVGVTTIGLMTPASVQRNNNEIAVAAPTPPIITIQPGQAPALVSPSLPGAQPGFQTVSSQPRYVIDARPVMYEPTSF